MFPHRLIAYFAAAIYLMSALTAFPAIPVPGANRSPFGAQTVWPENPDLLTILDRMQEAGIQWGRFDLCWWGLAEYAPGQYNFVNPPGWPTWNTVAAVDAMKARDIEPFPILSYSNPFYDNNTGPFSDAGRAAFAEYCYQAALLFKDKITYWEIWNEPNLEFFWGRTPHPQDYALLAITAAARIRAANPEAVVVGGVTAGIDQAFLTAAFDAGLLDAVDAITVHPYRIAAPETAMTEIMAVRAAIAARTARAIPVWSGEWGYNTWWSEVTPLGQAKCLSRMMVNNFANGMDLSIWFSTHAFVEASGAARDPEWGLLDYDYNPRPSFYAMQTLNRRLPAPVRPVDDPFATQASPVPSGWRAAFFERGDARHITVAVWLARWPLSDSFSGRTSTLSFELPARASFNVFDGLTNTELFITPILSSGRLFLPNFIVMDYPRFIEITLPPPVQVPKSDIVEHILERTLLPVDLQPFADYNETGKIEVGDVIIAPETVY